MKYFKDTNNQVHGIEEGFEHFLPSGCIEITEEEADAIANPPPTAEELQAQKNAEARAYLASTDWYVVRKAETGVEIPADVLAASQAARDSVVE